jgi:hypothetical protein
MNNTLHAFWHITLPEAKQISLLKSALDGCVQWSLLKSMTFGVFDLMLTLWKES